ncbi:unnamed protein product, partial [marine sediment metagenome]
NEVNGLLAQQQETGMFDEERQGAIASTEIKYTYT